MSDRHDRTVSLSFDDEPSGGRRNLLVFFIVGILGLAGGFAAAQFLAGAAEPNLPDSDLVLYESASTSFPIDGARFTDSTFDSSKQKCDKELLKRLLRADPRRFAAWLDLQEISEADFDGFVDRLRTKILAKATPVTNHGCFADGEGPCPFAVHSVLGPGTPVWIDPTDKDRIVAKCACSNPIKEPVCPPNCEEIPTPKPTPKPTPTPTLAPTRPPQTVPPPTRPPTPPPTAPPTKAPTPSPIVTPTPSLQPPA
jgi:hypothetical protein